METQKNRHDPDVLVFVVFGGAFLPLGMQPAPGTVTVKSYKKVVQHLEGGIKAHPRS